MHLLHLIRWLPLLLAVVASVGGCTTDARDDSRAEECQEIVDVVSISGTVALSPFTGGTIRLNAFEEASTRCAFGALTTVIIPGRPLGEVVLASPGVFRFTLALVRVVTDTVVGALPRIELSGFHDANMNGQCDAGDAAGRLFLPPQPQTDVQLTLMPENCLGLLRL